MKDDDRALFGSKSKDLFVVPEGSGMKSDVSDAAKILRSFVSRVGAPPEQDELSLFPMGDAENVLTSETSSSAEDSAIIDQYIESASEVSRHLRDEAPRITPRVITSSSDGIPAAPVPIPKIHLVYKGKASKRQLERLRKKVMQQAESRSSLQAAASGSGSWENLPGK